MPSRRESEETEMEAPWSDAADWTGGSYSFACGGWLKMYLFGVAKALQVHGLDKNARLIGCSAGALAASVLALHNDPDDIRDYVLDKILPIAHASLMGPFNIKYFMKVTMQEAGNFHRYPVVNASQQLTVVYTSLSSWASRRVSEFTSAQHLEDCLMASCCATPIAGLPFKMGGEWVMDGGLFDFQPVFDERTVTVSPFYCASADIKPSRYVPMWWAVYPPSRRNIEWLYDLGYEDGVNWIARSGKLGSKVIEIPHKAAEYKGDWHTTLGRVIGYHSFESRVLDWLFVILFLCVWKPIAFVFLYLELYLHAIVAGGKAALFGAATRFMLSTTLILCGMAMLATMRTEQRVLFLLGSLLMACFWAMLLFLSKERAMAAAVASTHWQTCCSCLRNITSLSLFLGSMPLLGSAIRIKRHDHLLKHSLIYRLALQFV